MKIKHIAFPVLGLALLQPLQAQNDSASQNDSAARNTNLAQQALESLRWRSVGPAAFGGRVVDVAVHPQNASIYYVATGSGGLFKTTNNGTQFRPVFENENTISIGDVALAPSNPDVVYVGTGEANNQRSSYWGDGVFKSADGGRTWTHCGLKGTDHIGRIVVHPGNENIVYVAAAGALYSKNKERGVYRSTDGGKTWAKVKYVDDGTGFIDICIDPKNPKVLYAASYERLRKAWNLTESGPGSAIWKSEDGGDSWTKLAGGLPEGKLGRIGLCIYPKDPNILYASIENRNDDGRPARGNRRRRFEEAEGNDELEEEQEESPGAAPLPAMIGGEVYRTEDAGKTWTKVNTAREDGRPNAVGGRPGYYYGQIRVDPQNDQNVYCLSVPVYASSDGGKTWRSDFGRGVHVDHHALWINPKNPNHALLGNDGGIHVTYDRGKTWDHLNHLPIGQFYAIGVDMRQPYWIYGGTQDNGTWGIPSRAGTTAGIKHRHATKIAGGDGFYAVPDYSNPDIVYCESQFGSLQRKNVRTGVSKRIKPRLARAADGPRSRRGGGLRSNWMSPIVISAHNPRTIYFGTQFLHRSRNRGDSWTKISDDLTTNDAEKIRGNVPHCTITTISESPRQEGLLWVGTDDGKVWVTKNDGGRWQDVTERFRGVPGSLWVSRVEASHHDANVAYVTFTGYREDIRKPFVYVTTDGGESFRSIAGNLPQHPINVVREHPRNKNVLLVGTEFGIFASANGGGEWHQLGQGLPTTPVHDIVVHPREHDVIIGTHGRGIYIADASILEELSDEVLAKAVHVFPPTNGVMLRREYSRGYPGHRNYSASNGSTSATFHYSVGGDVSDVINVRVRDASGRIVFQQRGNNEAGVHEVSMGGRGRGRGGRGQRGRGQRGGQRGRGQTQRGGFGNLTREQAQARMKERGMSDEEIKRILDQRFAQGGQGRGGQRRGGQGRGGQGRGGQGRRGRGQGRQRGGFFGAFGRRGPSGPGTYCLEIVIGNENEGGKVIKKVFKVTAYDGYQAGGRRRRGGEEEDGGEEDGK